MSKPLEIREAEKKVRAWNRQERKARAREHLAKVDPVKRARGRIRDVAHLAFIRRLPCVATYVVTGALVYGCQAAHLRLSSAKHGKPIAGGQGKPDDKWTTPLSPEAHRIQGDVKGEPWFWSDLGVDPFELCLQLYSVSGDDAAAIAIIEELRR